jgi:hypothetical protein
MGVSRYPSAISLDEAPLVIPSSMVFYTLLPARLAATNPTLLRDVVALLHYIDRQRTRRFHEALDHD